MDLNAGLDLDRTVEAFLEMGYLDVHGAFDVKARPTHAPGLILDVMVTNGGFFSQSQIAPKELWEPLSDHAPIWTTISLE